MRGRFIVLLIPVSLVLQNCQSGKERDPADENTDPIAMAFDQYASIESIRSESNPLLEGWVDHFFSKSDCRCIFNGEFFISLKNSYPESRNLMISLQGGGACWPGLEECKEEVFAEDIYTSLFTTLLDEELEEEWNQLLIPYCDGSVYAGDHEADYDGDGRVDHWHWGLRAGVAGLTLAKKSFPELEKVFITGCSAGGYGTFTVARLVRHQYPGARIYVLNESGPGLFPEDNETWSAIRQAWKLDPMIPGGCSPCGNQMIYWYDPMLENDGNLKIGLYSSYEDEVIGEEYLGMDPLDFRDLLLTSSGSLNEKYPDRFKRFFISGNSHCVEDHEYQIDGMRYRDWVLSLLNDSDQWKDLLE
ncbi:MAG: pectin acetylesterase-family hydrolase [Bacteroidales bacterium]